MFKVGDKVKLSSSALELFQMRDKSSLHSDGYVISKKEGGNTYVVVNQRTGLGRALSAHRLTLVDKQEVKRSMVSFCKILAPLQFAIVLLACLAVGITPELNVPVWALAGAVFFSCILMCFLSLAAAGVEILDNLLGESDEV